MKEIEHVKSKPQISSAQRTAAGNLDTHLTSV